FPPLQRVPFTPKSVRSSVKLLSNPATVPEPGSLLSPKVHQCAFMRRLLWREGRTRPATVNKTCAARWLEREGRGARALRPGLKTRDGTRRRRPPPDMRRGG